jgi:hypothetical protein
VPLVGGEAVRKTLTPITLVFYASSLIGKKLIELRGWHFYIKSDSKDISRDSPKA